jgi:TRAP-type C4-dicarboxylate transport system permease small subunit
MAHARLLIDQIIRFFCCLLLSAMIIIVTWQVISRYVLNAPSTFSEELLRFGVIWLSLLGAAYTAFAVAVLIVGGMWTVTIAAQQYSAVLRIPMGAIYAALPTSGVLIILYSVLDIVELLQGRHVEPSPVEKALATGD